MVTERRDVNARLLCGLKNSAARRCTDFLAIHIDPVDQMADYRKLPQADIIVVTHEHPDHMDLKAVAKLQTPKTVMIMSETCAKQIKGGIVMRNGDVN